MTHQAMLHGEHFVADSCSNVDSGYDGVGASQG